MSHQLNHQEKKFTPRKFPITLVCDHLESPANQGALFRVCEAFNIKEIIFYGNVIDIKSSRLKRTARSTEKQIPYSSVTEIQEVLKKIQNKNTQVIGLEITEDSRSIQDLSLMNNQEVALIIGNEKNGISPAFLKQINAKYHIPMYGNNSSMNVIQSTGIALYCITNKILSL